MNTRRPYFLGLTLVVLTVSVLISGCSLRPTPTPSPTPKPSALGANGSISGQVWDDVCTIASGTGGASATPSAGCTRVGEDNYRADGLLEADEPGIGGVSVQLGPGSCPAPGLVTVLTRMDGGYTFTGLRGGTYCIFTDASSPENAGLLPGQWTAPSADGSVASRTITLREDEQKADVSFGWDYQLVSAPGPETPEPSPAPPQPTSTPVPTPATTPAGCYDQAGFVEDISIPDNTLVTPGQSFVKTWRLLNSGTCTWTQEYALVFAGGNSLGGPASVSLPNTVAPGETVDVSVSLIAPAADGPYESRWLLRNAEGSTFGVGSGTVRVFWVRIVVGTGADTHPGDRRVAR